MSNHNNDFSDTPIPEERNALFKRMEGRRVEIEEMRRKFMRESLGPTGKHPEGKLTPGDDGEIAFAVGVKDGKVCIDFGVPVSWFGMPPHQAMDLAEMLIKHARAARPVFAK